MANPYLQVSRDASRALEEFSDQFRSALVLGDVVPWAEQLGFGDSSDALKTTYPIPLDAAGYKEFKGELKFRNLYHRSLSMVGKEWSDGVEIEIRKLEAPDFANWMGAPENMAREWLRLPNEMVASMLALGSLAGPLLDFYRDPDTETASARRLFATDHPYNVLDVGVGTFDNTMQVTTAEILSGAAFDEIAYYFSTIKGANGKPLGLRFDGGNLLVPSSRETLFEKALKDDLVIRAVSNAGVPDASANVVASVTTRNRHVGKSFTRADELANQDHFYAFAAPRPGLYPWIVQREASPEEIRFDKDSEEAKKTGKVKLAYKGAANAAACLPHGILRVEITA